MRNSRVVAGSTTALQATAVRVATGTVTLQGCELTGDTADRIRQLLDQQINPALASHGGFANLIGVDGEKAIVEMGGGCQGCAISAMTLRDGIERAIKDNVPEITEVVDATDHAAGENPFYS